MEEIPISIKSENPICHQESQEKVAAGTGFPLKAQLSTVKQGSGSHKSGGRSLNWTTLRDCRGDDSSSEVKASWCFRYVSSLVPQGPCKVGPTLSYPYFTKVKGAGTEVKLTTPGFEPRQSDFRPVP